MSKTVTTDSERTVTYTYNKDGIRTGKKVADGVYSCDSYEMTYRLDGDKIVEMKLTTQLGDWWYRITYDESGKPYSFTEDWGDGSETYYYVLNAQGDVIELREEDGSLRCRYTYDAWGKILSVYDVYYEYDEYVFDIAYINPLRYRGYIYDDDTDLYYCQSRYYDPQIRRFINADDILGANNDVTTANLFTYCGNNPVNRYDISGNGWKEFIKGVLHIGNTVAVALGFDTAAWGAEKLCMTKDSNGIYHVDFDCWQQYAGYNDFYDRVFDSFTSMDSMKLDFTYGGRDYTIWAWKGDYINLGAGAEIAIYINTGVGSLRYVDKDEAQYMTMWLAYKGERIANSSESLQWWCTGFNPKYLNKKADDLTAIYRIRFTSMGMYYAVKEAWQYANPNLSFYKKNGHGYLLFGF